MTSFRPGNVTFENRWKEKVPSIDHELLAFWKQHARGLGDAKAADRLRQIVFVVRNEVSGKVIAESTAEKVYIRQLRNHLYNFRASIDKEQAVSPALLPKLVTETCEFLESVYQDDGSPPAIGVITLMEGEGLQRVLTKAVLSASGLTYIGNSPRGYHIRVRYFKGAVINLEPLPPANEVPG